MRTRHEFGSVWFIISQGPSCLDNVFWCSPHSQQGDASAVWIRICTEFVVVVEALPGIWMESDSADPFPPSTLLVNSPFQWPAFWTQLGSGVYKWYWLTDSLRLLSACFQVLWYLHLLKDCIVHRFSCIQKYDPFVSEFTSCFTSWNWLIAPLWPF
jgi:hypothetical protein